jgi:hypothetical protein
MGDFIAKPELLEDHQHVRNVIRWGNRGPSGDSGMEYKHLCDMDTSHIYNILTTQQLTDTWVQNLYTELFWRASGRN